MLTQL